MVFDTDFNHRTYVLCVFTSLSYFQDCHLTFASPTPTVAPAPRECPTSCLRDKWSMRFSLCSSAPQAFHGLGLPHLSVSSISLKTIKPTFPLMRFEFSHCPACRFTWVALFLFLTCLNPTSYSRDSPEISPPRGLPTLWDHLVVLSLTALVRHLSHKTSFNFIFTTAFRIEI